MKKSNIKTLHQVSAGGVIYRVKPNGIVEVAIAIRQGGKVWCLPKGIVEKGESPETTAIREVREETGLLGELQGKLGEISYWFYSKSDQARIHKTVHFFLLKYLSGSTENHDFEMDEVRWLPIEEAVQRLSYASERQMVEKALEKLQDQGNGCVS